jgi:hypothetical protein
MDCEFTLNQIDFGFRPFSRLCLLFLKENPTSPFVKEHSHFGQSPNLHRLPLPRLLCPIGCRIFATPSAGIPSVRWPKSSPFS